MKKTILLLSILIISSSNLYSQNSDYTLSTGIGLSYFNEDTQDASPVGVSFSLSVYNFYFGFASNLAKGKGEELDYSSSETYNANKTSVAVINFGYIIDLNKFGIVPLIGYGSSRKIYEDPISFDTYFYGDRVSKINFGVKGMYFINDTIGITLGIGTYEMLTAAINFRF